MEKTRNLKAAKEVFGKVDPYYGSLVNIADVQIAGILSGK